MEEKEKWDSLVRSFPNYDVYYLSGYAKAFQLHGDGEPILFYYENHGLRAINVVMKRDIKQNKYYRNFSLNGLYYDIATPYGYGGLLLEGEINETSKACFDDEYTSYCQRAGIISEFVRFHPILNNCDAVSDLYKVTRLGKTVSMTMESRDQIWSDMAHPHRNRVRKAQEAGVEVYWAQSADRYETFIPLYNDTMNKVSAKDYYFFKPDFYHSVLHDLRYNAMVFSAVYQGITIAMAIILFANRQMHCHLTGSIKEYQYLSPTNLLFYEAACWGYENGFHTFHLGGGLGSANDSLYDFKYKFNKKSDHTFAIGEKIFDAAKYSQLVELRSSQVVKIRPDGMPDLPSDAETSYFPKYRTGIA